MRLILASRSPQRRAILEQVGIEFELRVPDVDELEEGKPAEVALANAASKAQAVRATGPGQDALVLGVDTVVALDARMYGKPGSRAEAEETLTALSGRVHTVISGLCVQGERVERTGVAQTQVRFRALSRRLIDWYLASGEWRDRAGAYAIQGRGAVLVEAIDGDYFNVVGLPVAALIELIPEFPAT